MKIVNSCSGMKIWWLEKRINSLLRTVPHKDLMDLHSIVLVDEIFPLKNNTLGRYHHRSKSLPPRIELAIKTIFEGVPKILIYLPHISIMLIGSVLYHEIGHHYQKTNFDLKKEKWEKYADTYRNNIFRKRYKTFIFISKPFVKLYRYIKNYFNRNIVYKRR